MIEVIFVFPMRVGVILENSTGVKAGLRIPHASGGDPPPQVFRV